MNKFKLGVLAMAIFAGNSFALNNTSANFQASATLNSTCTIKTPANDVVVNILPSRQQNGFTVGAAETNIILACTNNTTVSVSISPNTPYQAGDDPYNELEIRRGFIPRGTLTGTNPENKLAYALYILDMFPLAIEGAALQPPPNTLNVSYNTWGNGGFDIIVLMDINILSKVLAKPDTYKDTVTINITY